MAAFNKFQAFVADVANKVHNLGADTLKIMLTDVAPLATNSIKANLTEIAAGNGYAAGGTGRAGAAIPDPHSAQERPARSAHPGRERHCRDDGDTQWASRVLAQ